MHLYIFEYATLAAGISYKYMKKLVWQKNIIRLSAYHKLLTAKTFLSHITTENFDLRFENT